MAEATETEFTQTDPWDVIVIGAGAAGLFAGGTSAARGRRTLVLEKNTKLGVKILMSGGTRCNLTHDTDWRGIADAFGKTQGRFLKFALASLPPDRIVAFFEQLGVATKIESTGKVFPLSNRAIDVRNALVRYAMDAGTTILNPCPVDSITRTESGFMVTVGARKFQCRSVIITSGGQSYPGCGTTGDGYSWMSFFGHQIVSPRPALAPLRSSDDWVHNLSGMTVTDVGVNVTGRGGETIHTERKSDRGSFLFTHFGVSGPVAMNVSRALTDPANSFSKLLVCDWLPGRPLEQFQQELQHARGQLGAQTIVNWLSTTIPRRLGEVLCQLAACQPGLRLAELNRKQYVNLCTQLKACKISVDGTLGFKKAEVTSGGVALQQVNAKTMESKIVPGLFLAGEILDVDGPIGGYNFQAAFSTGYLAGLNA